jgi:hypothetical protein
METRDGARRPVWHPVDVTAGEEAGWLGCRWLPSNPGIDGAEVATVATVVVTGCELLTLNVIQFPMFAGLEPPD